MTTELRPSSRLNTVPREVLLHVEAWHFVVRVAYLNCGDASVRCVCRNVAEYNCACANLCSVADVDVA